MKILITGGAGFIGSHIVEHLLKNTEWNIVIIDRLNYASNGFDRLRDINAYDDKRVTLFTHDFTKPIVDGLAQEIGLVDYILHLGAETHVDNSIKDPKPFVMSNVVGTMNMLEFARTQKNLQKFVYFSTDEVFGPAPNGVFFKEWDRYNSGNPYSAAKAGGEELALAYANTYGVPVIITHTMNVFGERQHPEKFIPMCINKILKEETIQIHANKNKTRAGSRFWIHGRNVAAAILFLLNNPYKKDEFNDHVAAPKYNIVGEKELDNLTLAKQISYVLGRKLKYEMVDFHSSRPGHDLRYALDGNKMKSIGWSLPVDFEVSLRKTILWSISNPKWLKIYGEKI